jgi:hypothetical protein
VTRGEETGAGMWTAGAGDRELAGQVRAPAAPPASRPLVRSTAGAGRVRAILGLRGGGWSIGPPLSARHPSTGRGEADRDRRARAAAGRHACVAQADGRGGPNCGLIVTEMAQIHEKAGGRLGSEGGGSAPTLGGGARRWGCAQVGVRVGGRGIDWGVAAGRRGGALSQRPTRSHSPADQFRRRSERLSSRGRRLRAGSRRA